MGDSQNYRLMERDIQVILDVYKYRYLSVSQIMALRFQSMQTARRRLRMLTGSGHLQGFTAPGIQEHIYHLASEGVKTVASHLELPVGSLKWGKDTKAPKDYYFLKHFLKSNDFRIMLTKACEVSGSGIKLLGYIPEYYGEKTNRGGVVKYIRDFVCDVHDQSKLIHHTPDGVFALEKNGNSALFFLEMDRGTEALTVPEKGFLKCFQFYLNYWMGDKYQRYAEDFNCEPFKAFRALFITTSRTRVDNMRQAATSVHIDPPVVKKFIWLTTDGKLNQGSVFQRIWQSADMGDESLYGIG